MELGRVSRESEDRVLLTQRGKALISHKKRKER
jgi:hypothetical protein